MGFHEGCSAGLWRSVTLHILSFARPGGSFGRSVMLHVLVLVQIAVASTGALQFAGVSYFLCLWPTLAECHGHDIALTMHSKDLATHGVELYLYRTHFDGVPNV